jgi:hypothetical protein
VSVERFLKQRAVRIAVTGTYTLANWYDPQGKLRTFTCRTTRVSPFRMMVEVPVVGKVGDRLTSYFPDFGRLDGSISDAQNGSFLMELEMTRAMRRRLAGKLTWLEMKLGDSSISDFRKHGRVIPPSPPSSLTLADGTIHECSVIDMSAGGAAVAAEVQPAVGLPLAVGTCVGRVVRHLPDGFAIQFVETQRSQDLERILIRPLAPSFTATPADYSSPSPMPAYSP